MWESRLKLDEHSYISLYNSEITITEFELSFEIKMILHVHCIIREIIINEFELGFEIKMILNVHCISGFRKLFKVNFVLSFNLLYALFDFH